MRRRRALYLFPYPALSYFLLPKIVYGAGLEKIPPDFLASLLGQIESGIRKGAAQPLEIKTEFLMNNPDLYVEDLVFFPQSKLILSGVLGSADQKIIVAKRILVHSSDGKSSPSITWARESMERRIPVPAGKAPPGESGANNGDGFNGVEGVSGNAGFPGRSAPNLIICYGSYTGGPIKVDLPGQTGGKGGQGQIGGDGGHGRPGEGSYSTPFSCGRDPTSGGKGGDGGRGGPGGPGGKGGNGGSLMILKPDNSDNTEGNFQTHLAPGDKGPGGEPAPGGRKGLGGAPGRSSGYCRSNAAPGKDGTDGGTGGKAQEGKTGVAGEARVALLMPEQAKLIGLN